MKTIATIALCICISFGAFAQKAAFSGKWVFKSHESISGNLYVNGSPKLIGIDISDNLLSLEKTTEVSGNDITTIEKIPNGKNFEFVGASKRKKIVSVSWAKDGNSFITSTKVYDDPSAKNLVRIITDTYSLEYGELVLVRKDENIENGEVWESKALYEH